MAFRGAPPFLSGYVNMVGLTGVPDFLTSVKRKLPVTQTTIPLTPEQRIRELEAQLELANQKAEFFESVINVLKK